MPFLFSLVRGLRGRSTRSILGALFSVLSLAACGASTQRGASDVHLTQAQSRASQGAQLYQKECASCHGDRGQGLAGGPTIIGPSALPEYPTQSSGAGNPQLSNPGQVQTQRLTTVPGAASRGPFRTAADVYQYISTKMPYPPRESGSLNPEEYWAILNFMLLAHGMELPEGGITEANASSVHLPR